MNTEEAKAKLAELTEAHIRANLPRLVEGLPFPTLSAALRPLGWRVIEVSAADGQEASVTAWTPGGRDLVTIPIRLHHRPKVEPE